MNVAEFRKEAIAKLSIGCPELLPVVESTDPTVWELLANGHFPSCDEVHRHAAQLNLPQSTLRNAYVEIWQLGVRQSGGLAECPPFDEEALLRSISELVVPDETFGNVLVIWRSVVGWNPEGDVVLDLIEDDGFSIARAAYALRKGARFFDSPDSLRATVAREKWPGWEEFVGEREELPQER